MTNLIIDNGILNTISDIACLIIGIWVGIGVWKNLKVQRDILDYLKGNWKK